MTDTWAAKVLEGVPRFQTMSGNMLPEADALTAIARMGAGDGLVERATAALEGVTEGPWKAAYSRWEPNNFIVQTDHPCRRVLAQFDGDGDGPDDQSLADARFIAFTRQWVPEAAAHISALTAQVAEARADLSGMVSEGRRMRAEYNIAVDQLAAAAARETESQTVRAEALKEAADAWAAYKAANTTVAHWEAVARLDAALITEKQP